MNNRFRTLTIAIPVLLVAVLLLTTSAAGARQLLQHDQFPQLDEPLPVEGKQATWDDPGAEVPLQHSEPTPDESPASNSEILSIEAHHVVSPRDLSGQGNSIQVPASPEAWTVILEEGFEGAFPGPWIVFDGDGIVNGEYYWDDVSNRSYTGSWSGWPANGGVDGLTPPANYPHNAKSWMIYGPFDLSDAVDAELQFYYWLDTQPTNDWFGWYASINGTTFYGHSDSGSSGGWTAVNFDLTNVFTLGDLSGEPEVWIAFVFVSDAADNGYEGVYLDDILLQKHTANLTPYTPSGWDYPIVPSSVTGTHTVGDLYLGEPAYIDWAVINSGPADITDTVTTCLYLDSVEDACWFTFGLPQSAYAWVPDWTLAASPSAGWHNLEIVTDVYDDIPESDETDNSWSMDFYWQPPDIAVTPPALFSQQKPDQTNVLALDINNLGLANLDWTIIEALSPACTPSDIPWVSVAPDMGTTPASGSTQIDVTFDSTGLAAGYYSGVLCVNSNDPDTPQVVVPLELEVYTLLEIDISPQEFDLSLLEGSSHQDSLFIDNLGDGSLEWTIFSSTGGIDVLGGWNFYYDWDCAGTPGSTTITFHPDFTFDTGQSENGTWTQTDNLVVWTYTNGTQYTGFIAGSHMAGTMEGFGGGSGCWETIRPPAGAVTLEADRLTASGELSSSPQTTIIETAVEIETEAALTWLNLDPLTGWLPHSQQQVVSVEVNSSDLPPDSYYGLIRLYSNDPDEALTAIPLVLEVAEMPHIYIPLVMRP